MHYATKAALAAGFLLMSSNAIAQLSGTITIPSGTYPNLASAITALNTQGVGTGGVILNLAANNPQTAPAGGYLLGSATLNASTSAAKTITINGNGNTVTANTGTSLTTDGIFVIQGVDYLTINALNLSENATNTTATAQMEWGYALVKRNATAPFDGCQNVTIQNCTITLNRANPASVGIYAGNHIATATTDLAITAVTDANSYLSCFSDTVQNCYTGISLNGSSAAGFADVNNRIGDGSLAYTNVIRNFGGGTTAQYGIYAQNQYSAVISGNVISNAAGGGVAGGNAALSGIYTQNLTNFTVLNNNRIILQQGTGTNAGAVTGIRDHSALSTAVSGNTISGSGGATGTWNGIDLAGGTPTITVANNTFSDINVATTAALHLIHVTAVAAAASTITVTNNTTSGTATPYVQKTGGGNNFAFYYNVSGATNTVSSISGNTVNQVALTGSTTFYGIYAYDATASGTKTVSNNTVSNIAGGTSAMYPISAGVSATGNMYGNTVTGVSGGGIIYCLYANNNTAANIYNNKVTGVSGLSTNATVYGTYCNSASGTFNVYNNFFTDLTAPATSSNTGVNGIYSASGTINAFSNTIVLGKAGAITGGANFSCAGIYSSSSLTLKNNIIYVNATPTGTGLAACIKRNTVSNPSGTAPAMTAFAADNNVYYINPGPQNYIYEENITVATVKNGYALNSLTANATNNIVNDPGFNKSCSAYKAFMAANGESNSYFENNITALTAGSYAPSGSSYAESGGAVLALVTTDYANASRSTPPDIGALQFAGTAFTPVVPTIAYTPLANTSICTATSLQATITAGGGNTINTTTAGPRMYFRKSTEANIFGTYPADNVASFNGWKYVTATGTAPNFSFSPDYTLLGSALAVTDTILYFVVAEDNAAVPNAAAATVAFAAGYCLTGVNIPPAAGGVAATPAVNRYVITAAPALTLNVTRDTVCRNAIHMISVTSPASNFGVYIWSPAAYLYTDAAATIPYTGTSITTVYAKQPLQGMGIYTVQAGNIGTPCYAMRNDTLIVPVLDTGITGQHSFCAGDSTTLSVASGNAYQWLSSGAAITGATASTYTVHAAGSYSVVVTGVRGCSDTSSSYAIAVNPLPVPVVALNNGVLSTGTFLTYQWLQNGAPVGGATSSTYTPTQSGSYSVKVTDANGCTATSAPVAVTVSNNGVGTQVGNVLVSLFPNPVRAELNVRSASPVNISILSMDGKLLLYAEGAVKIDVSSLAAGMYMVRISDRGNRLISMEKLVKGN